MLRWDMGVMFARSYVLQLSDNVKRSLEQKVKNGQWVGQAHLGYINDTYEKDNKTIVPDPAKAHLVRKIFELYATGNYSIRVIRDNLSHSQSQSVYD